jgi:hypothetical protein
MKEIVFLILFTACPCVFGGEISELYFKNLDSNTNGLTAVASTNQGITEIGIERSACFGECPVYTFILKSDGTFRYEGEKFVKRKGQFTGTISISEFDQLAQTIKNAGYMKLNKTYRRPVTDLPTAFTMVIMDGRRKIIMDYADSGPQKLQAIEKLIDGLMEKAKWNNLPKDKQH